MKLEELNPLSKFSVALIGAIIVIFVEGILPLSIFFILASSLALLSGYPKQYFRFLILALPFLAIVWLVNAAFTFCGEVILNLYTWKLTYPGLLIGTNVMLRIAIIVVFSYIFVTTTNPRDLVYALVKYFRMNYSIAFAAFITLRLLRESRVLMDEFNQAYKARALNPLNPRRIPSLISLIFFSIMRKLFSIAVSAESRGFGAYERRLFRSNLSFNYKDYLFFLMIALFFVISFYIGYIFNDFYIGLYPRDLC